ncbi:MAG: nickel-dependent lactate racemase [Christensenella sp.]|nr:nickel-dependent lactate racemase [Christensenella sp.]
MERILEFGYGSGIQRVALERENLLGILLPNPVDAADDEEDEIQRAISGPIGCPLLRNIVKPNEKIVIVTSDITRPCPTHLIMPFLLDELYAAGVKPHDITLVFALGSHRKHTEQEKMKLAGARAYSEIRCIDSDGNDFIFFGKTPLGTPVDIVRTVAEADRRICLGNIEYHYFAGYSGGAKAIMPGVSTRAAIQANHAHMTSRDACAGKIKGNPVREDIEAAAKIVGVDFIVNVVLDEHKRIIKAVAGDVTAAHRAGCAFLDSLYLKHIPCRADIVLVSQGGFPKDLNLYQTQKALDNAKHAVRKGGIIILIGRCDEGMGEATFEDWMINSHSPQDLIDRIRTDFKLGGHKAAAIAMVLHDADIYLVSDMDSSFVQNIHLKPYQQVQAAYADACTRLGRNATVIAMPYGGSTLPRVYNEQFD